MKVFYFSSTGNGYYIAGRIAENECYSIPCVLRGKENSFQDEVIGIVFPVYGLCVPPVVEEFLEKVRLDCQYLFAIASYGFFAGAITGHLQEIGKRAGLDFQYINRIKMVENYLPMFDMAKQSVDELKIEAALQGMVSDIEARRHYMHRDSLFGRIMTSHHKKAYEYHIGEGITGEIHVEDNCSGCGICTKVCPGQNIELREGKPQFGQHCLSCMACTHLCPQNAIRLKSEKSRVRYRNPHVSISDMIDANQE